MLDYKLDIADNSKWVICTKPEVAKALPFYITEAGEFYAKGGYYTERDGRDGLQLIYTVSGEGRLIADNTETRLLPGSAVIIRCGEHHRYETVGNGWHNFWLHFDGTGAKGYEDMINDGEYCVVPISGKEEIESNLMMILTVSAKNDMLSSALISDCISRIMTEILTQKLSCALNGDSGGGKYPEIHSVLEFIHKHYGETISIDDMTEKMNISKYHFIRVFKRQMGVTPYEYLTEYRINMAKILLRTTYKSVFEIAFDVGYNSKSNFIAKFHSMTGVTPSQYRKENIAINQK